MSNLVEAFLIMNWTMHSRKLSGRAMKASSAVMLKDMALSESAVEKVEIKDAATSESGLLSTSGVTREKVVVCGSPSGIGGDDEDDDEKFTPDDDAGEPGIVERFSEDG